MTLPPHPSFAMAQAKTPPINEEYFEWADLCEAASQAGETFTFFEMGAGLGRWSMRAVEVARKLGKHPRLCLAEAEPRHIAEIIENMNKLGVDFELIEAAVAGAHGEIRFAVSQPPGAQSAKRWMGQAITSNSMTDAVVEGEYHGHPLWRLKNGWGVIMMPSVPLSDILSKYDFIDLIDFDIQGAEADAIEEAIEPLTAKVRRLHIGTHGREIEARLRATLSAAGWQCVWDFANHQENDTPWGRVSFVDGVQSWINPGV